MLHHAPTPAARGGGREESGAPGGCIITHEKKEELPMSEETLRGLYWAGVIVFALAILFIWGRMIEGII